MNGLKRILPWSHLREDTPVSLYPEWHVTVRWPAWDTWLTLPGTCSAWATSGTRQSLGKHVGTSGFHSPSRHRNFGFRPCSSLSPAWHWTWQKDNEVQVVLDNYHKRVQVVANFIPTTIGVQIPLLKFFYVEIFSSFTMMIIIGTRPATIWICFKISLFHSR